MLKDADIKSRGAGISAAGKGRLTILKERCKGCGLCMAFCPRDTLSFSGELNKLGYHPVEETEGKQCTGCGICALMCPDIVIQVERVTADEG